MGDNATAEVPANASEPEQSPSGLAEAIAGDVSWGSDSFRDRSTADPDEPEPEGDGGTTEVPSVRHECEPVQSLAECYG